MAASKKTATAEKKKTTAARPRADATASTADDKLAPYLQVEQQAKEWFIGSLSQGGHTATIYGKSKDEVVQRAKTILTGRGIEV